ncbi:hypothetical protein ACFYX8_09795 [Streptomyces cyaneofuscatus]|uniref:hypothetical protein n=1 Tax=Streptomyces cyaneofuscatus TaxID=66883 RepID=UPI00368CC0E0
MSLFTDVRMGWGGSTGCVRATWLNGSSADTRALFPSRADAQVRAVPEYCATDMDGYQRVLDILGELPWVLLLIGGLVLLNQLLKSAGRDGVYTLQTATRVSRLGWLLLAGSIIAEVVQANAKAALLGTLSTEAPYTVATWLNIWTPPYLAILTGLGLLTFSRIIRAGADMRDDLEGLI